MYMCNKVTAKCRKTQKPKNKTKQNKKVSSKIIKNTHCSKHTYKYLYLGIHVCTYEQFTFSHQRMKNNIEEHRK